jgi:site-specific recombinase XerD
MPNTPHNEQPPRRPLRTLGPEQQETLIRFMNDCETWHGADGVPQRNLCMVLLMLDAGLRVAEVAGLRRIDVWFGEGPVVDLTVPATIAKNGIERCVPLSDRLRKAIFDLFKSIPGQPLDAMFLPAFSANTFDRDISTRQIERIVKSLTLACLGVGFTPHSLRHSFATKMMHLTDTRTLQMLLGHSSLTSTQVYTHPTLSDLRAAINKTNNTEPKK